MEKHLTKGIKTRFYFNKYENLSDFQMLIIRGMILHYEKKRGCCIFDFGINCNF